MDAVDVADVLGLAIADGVRSNLLRVGMHIEHSYFQRACVPVCVHTQLSRRGARLSFRRHTMPFLKLYACSHPKRNLDAAAAVAAAHEASKIAALAEGRSMCPGMRRFSCSGHDGIA